MSGSERIDVFIEGSRDASAEGRARLAVAISEKFGLPRERVEQGLAEGRVRAKAGTDSRTAESLKAQLERLGAIVGLSPTEAPSAAAPAAAKKASPAPAPPPPNRPTPPPTPAKAYESGLAAAANAGRGTGENRAIAALDRIAQAPQDSISLSSLDGSDPGVAAPLEGQAPSPGSSRNLFGPPSDFEEPRLELALPARPPTSPPLRPPAPTPPTAAAPRPGPTPPGAVSAPAETSLSGRTSPRPTVAPGPPPRVAPPPTLLDEDRKRWIIGLALGLALGFAVAHLWGARAEARYDTIRVEALAAAVPQNDEEYALALERHEIATATLARAHSRARLTAGFLWLVVGAGVAFSWNRWGKPRSA